MPEGGLYLGPSSRGRMSTAAPGPEAAAAPPKKPSNVVSIALTGIGLLLVLVSAFLTWFTISGSNFTLLPDAYNAMWVYITKGSSGLQTLNAFGEYLVKGSTSNPLVIIGFALVLFFWPATLVSSIYNMAAREFAPYPFIWAIIAFISAYIMVHFGSDASLGEGTYLLLAGAILMLVAAFTWRRPKATPAPATPAATPAATPQAPS